MRRNLWFPSKSPAVARFGALAALPFLAVIWTANFARAQAPAAGAAPAEAAAPKLNAAELEELVGRIALYPDDLIAIILPASTYPLDIVQAERLLEKLKTNKDLKPDESWHESVKALLNYPEVVKTMSQELEWTEKLGEAVVSQQSDVITAIQAFRAKAQKAGNLKTDDKQVVVVEKEVIEIVPADPEVIYVPSYEPSVVVVQQPAPVYTYYPTAYPVYYYPYPPGAAFATGFFFGASAAWACDWHDHDIDYDVDVDHHIDSNRERNVNRDRTGDTSRTATRPGTTGTTPKTSKNWRSEKTPGQISSGRVASRPAASTGARPSTGAATRPSTGAATRPSTGAATRPSTGAATRPSTGAATRPSTGAAPRPSTGAARSTPRVGDTPSPGRTSDGVSRYGGGQSTARQAQRGGSSRSSAGISRSGSRGGASRGGGGGGRRR
jgi:uncharacterized membrane protein YgcG